MMLPVFFWILILLWIVLGGVSCRQGGPSWGVWGGGLILFLLIVILGFKAFGNPLA